MGFFDRIKNAFKEEQITELEISLEDLILKLEKNIEKQNAAILEKSYKKTDSIENEITLLNKLIDNFEKIEQDAIQGSKAVKERFCQYSKNQLASIKKPSKNLNDIKEFLNKTDGIMKNLGCLTPKQLMHIEFFFRDDFIPIAKKVREISDIMSEMKEVMKSDSDSYNHVKSLYHKLDSLDRRISESNTNVAMMESEIEKLREEKEKLLKSIDDINVADLEKCKEGINICEKRIDLIEQNITSFLSVEKLLKKLAYQKEKKNELLDLYIKSPVRALLEDGNLKIIGLVEEAAELIEKAEQKMLEKANRIINGSEYLKKQRKGLLEAMEELKEMKNYMENNIIPRVERRKRFEDEKNKIENKIKKLQESLEGIPKENAEIEKEKIKIKNEIALIASKLLGMKIKIK